MPASARGKASLSCTAFNDMCEMIWFRHNSNIKVDLNSFVLPTGRKLQDTKVLNFGKFLVIAITHQKCILSRDKLIDPKRLC